MAVPAHRRPLRLLGPDDRSSDTPQTPGMRRYATISGRLTGSTGLWMGGNVMAPGDRSGDHHHGPADSGIYVVAGHPRFVCLDAEGEELVLEASPGDFVFVPAYVPHREENPSADEEATIVLARSTPEEIVVALADLHATDGIPGA